MMNFTCTYCEKPINGVSILLDKTHFLHQGCEKAFKENIVGKWGPLFEEGGFLHRLKGHVKEDIAKEYECCKSAKIND